MEQWSKLSAQEKAQIIKFAIKNGVSDINSIRDTYNVYASGGSIHIDKNKNRETFIAAATKHGKSVQEFARQVLANKENYSPAMVRKANFARNSAHWHEDGGYNWRTPVGTNRSYLQTVKEGMQDAWEKAKDNPFVNMIFPVKDVSEGHTEALLPLIVPGGAAAAETYRVLSPVAREAMQMSEQEFRALYGVGKDYVNTLLRSSNPKAVEKAEKLLNSIKSNISNNPNVTKVRQELIDFLTSRLSRGDEFVRNLQIENVQNTPVRLWSENAAKGNMNEIGLYSSPLTKNNGYGNILVQDANDIPTIRHELGHSTLQMGTNDPYGILENSEEFLPIVDKGLPAEFQQYYTIPDEVRTRYLGLGVEAMKRNLTPTQFYKNALEYGPRYVNNDPDIVDLMTRYDKGSVLNYLKNIHSDGGYLARNSAKWHKHDGDSDTQYLNTEVYEPWFPDRHKEEYGFNIGQWLRPVHVREMQLGNARNHSEASSYLVDSNKEFINDYISRLSATHPELSSTALSDIEASLSPESISFIPDSTFAKSNSAGETVAHREGNKIIPEIRLRDNIGYYDTPNKSRDLSNIFRHELNHFLRKYQGNYADSIFNQDERDILNSAYFAVSSTLERAAENARLRSIISQNHDNVWGKELDDIIDNLSYEDLLSYISNMEGYMKDSESLYTAPDKKVVADLQSRIAKKDKERDAILNTVIYPKYLMPYEDGVYIKDNIINKYKTKEGEDASGVRDAMLKEWDENKDLKRIDSERKNLENELKKILMVPNKERLDAVKRALKQVAQNNSGFQKSDNSYLAALGGNLKSTGGPIYPFSFQKNPYLKIPAVRYDEGGEIREFARQVLANPENYSPVMRRKANFTRNSAKWHKHDGDSDTQYLNTEVYEPWLPDFAYNLSIQSDNGKQLVQSILQDEGLQKAVQQKALQRQAEREASRKAVSEIYNGMPNPGAGFLNGTDPLLQAIVDMTPAGDAEMATEAASELRNGNLKEAGLLGAAILLPNIFNTHIKKWLVARKISNIIDESSRDYAKRSKYNIIRDFNAPKISVPIEEGVLYHATNGRLTHPKTVFLNSGKKTIKKIITGIEHTAGELSLNNGVYESTRRAGKDAIDYIWWDSAGHNKARIVYIRKPNGAVNVLDNLNSLGISATRGYYKPSYFVTFPGDASLDNTVKLQYDPFLQSYVPSVKGKIVTNRMSPTELLNLLSEKSTEGPLYPSSFQNSLYLNIPAVRYGNGGKKLMPSKAQIVRSAWDNENPFNKGLLKNGMYEQYDDPNGEGRDVGPGLLVGATIPDKKLYTRQELDDAAYAFGMEGLASIEKAYNEKYGTEKFPTPFDTVSVAPKLLLLDTRYQNGRLPIANWPALYQSVADGNWAEALKNSRSTYIKDGVKHYDNDRVRRRAESIFSGMFDVIFTPDSKEFPKVISRKKSKK